MRELKISRDVEKLVNNNATERELVVEVSQSFSYSSIYERMSRTQYIVHKLRERARYCKSVRTQKVSK